MTNCLVLADDSGLEVDYLDKARPASILQDLWEKIRLTKSRIRRL